jgi:DNA-binding transcriptional LysR family regulator
MRGKIDWESQIGRRLRFRDLHVFFAVVQHGSMSKAAAHLGVSAPTVSEVIADLEDGLGVRLFDRGPQGVEPTIFGQAFLRRGRAAFDELKEGIRDIEFLADPTVGRLRVGCDESIAAATLPAILLRFAQEYPGVIVEVEDLYMGAYPPQVRELGFDLVMTRMRRPPRVESDPLNDPAIDLNVQRLFSDELVVAAGAQTKWAGRRKIDLAELVNERWILSAPTTWNYLVLAEAFRARGLEMPKQSVQTLSVHLRSNLVASGEFISTLPRSVLQLYAGRLSLKALAIDLQAEPWPVVLLTAKNRTLTPVVGRFIECIREVLKPEQRRRRMGKP